MSLMLPWVTGAAYEDSTTEKVVGYEGYQRTICLVDDDPVLRGFLSDLLIPLGFKTLEAFDGSSCLELVETAKPDLFILDVSMPGMTGIELASELRQHNINVPIIMLSANAVVPDKETIAQGPYSDYLV